MRITRFFEEKKKNVQRYFSYFNKMKYLSSHASTRNEFFFLAIFQLSPRWNEIISYFSDPASESKSPWLSPRRAYQRFSSSFPLRRSYSAEQPSMCRGILRRANGSAVTCSLTCIIFRFYLPCHVVHTTSLNGEYVRNTHFIRLRSAYGLNASTLWIFHPLSPRALHFQRF